MSGVVVNILTRLGIIGAAKGDTTARQATVSEIDANHNALDVSVKGTPALAADAATATLQGTGNTSLASILAKLIAAPATEAKQDAGNTSLASILAKLIAAPSTEAKQDTGNTSLATLAGIVAASKALVTETSAADILTAITAMSGKLPASLGYKAASASLSIIFGAPTPTISLSIPIAGLVVKASPGIATWVQFTNNTGSSVYLHVYDLASGPPANGARAAWAASAITANGASRPSDPIGGPLGLGTANGILVALSLSPVTYSAVASTNASVSFQSY